MELIKYKIKKKTDHFSKDEIILPARLKWVKDNCTASVLTNGCYSYHSFIEKKDISEEEISLLEECSELTFDNFGDFYIVTLDDFNVSGIKCCESLELPKCSILEFDDLGKFVNVIEILKITQRGYLLAKQYYRDNFGYRYSTDRREFNPRSFSMPTHFTRSFNGKFNEKYIDAVLETIETGSTSLDFDYIYNNKGNLSGKEIKEYLKGDKISMK